MKLRQFTILWIVITLFMTYEYLVLNRFIGTPSLLQSVLCGGLGLCQKLNPKPGKNLSYALGWIGFCTMALTNLYIMRKRMLVLQKLGTVQGWLDWHIFFGLLGPTLVVFHSNFKVGGLVGIAFWSMVISFLSGIVGRYLYMQLIQGKVNLRTNIDQLEARFDAYIKSSGGRLTEKHLLAAKNNAFAMAGGLSGEDLKQHSLPSFILRSILAELRMTASLPSVPWKGAPREFRATLKVWAIYRRRLIDMHYYQLAFGYWRSFHSPFAIWMYVVALIHIVSSLIFKVS